MTELLKEFYQKHQELFEKVLHLFKKVLSSFEGRKTKPLTLNNYEIRR